MFYCMVYFSFFLFFSIVCFLLGLLFISKNLLIFLEIGVLNLFGVSIEGVFFLDWKTFLFMSFVLFISSMILNYSSEYMSGDKYIKRFIFLMVLFVCSMMMLILNLNLVSILIGWDGLGLVSYALVIYYQNVKSNSAGMLTALSNRIGDAAIILAISFSVHFGSFNFIFYLSWAQFDQNVENFMKMVLLLIILASMTKSAQLPFSSWLPAAMAAPTPVSSLVHSSTLVTAGVYFLIRVSEALSFAMMEFLLIISLLTMFMAGLAANFEYDLKKIIALSTLSQLGLMMTILSLGESNLAFMHLLIHALFKALLFMCAGAIIHNFGDNQDIRNMGGLSSNLPLTSACMNISNFALCGLPFLSGFYSKDLIAEALSMQYSSMLVYLIFYLSIGLTVAYSIRLSYYIFWSESKFSSLSSFSDNNNWSMTKSMLGLVVLVVLMGSFYSWVFMDISYFIILPVYMKLSTVFFIILGLILGIELVQMEFFYKNLYLEMKNISLFLVGMWNMPIISTMGASKYALYVGKMYFLIFDQGWLEYYGSKGAFNIMSSLLSQIQYIFSSNHLKLFFLLFIIYFSGLLSYYFYMGL
uniref:NADH-ubiquinone oxidoreductase chain 5 n=1 Tax=Ips calligraphus TaxID=102827 RepID=A0A8B0KGY6_9CUCU|nr:NADH dehydrogenase subunit 5 [Ips calligraphus]QTV76823.1 NADH dehydrogenase subunit 5 [Ips calligraphus]